MYYSKTTNGFYISPTTKNPDDLVEISDALYSKVFDDQAKGMVIVAGDDGLPTTIDRVDERTDDEKRADNIAQLKSQAKLTELDEVKKQGSPISRKRVIAPMALLVCKVDNTR